MKLKQQIRGAFDRAPEPDWTEILLIFGNWYYRTGQKPDGEWGEVQIRPSELRNLIAFLLLEHSP